MFSRSGWFFDETWRWAAAVLRTARGNPVGSCVWTISPRRIRDASSSTRQEEDERSVITRAQVFFLGRARRGWRYMHVYAGLRAREPGPAEPQSARFSNTGGSPFVERRSFLAESQSQLCAVGSAF